MAGLGSHSVTVALLAFTHAGRARAHPARASNKAVVPRGGDPTQTRGSFIRVIECQLPWLEALGPEGKLWTGDVPVHQNLQQPP